MSSGAGVVMKKGFQSTLPLRGVTVAFSTLRELTAFQSTLPLRGVTVEIVDDSPSNRDFNPHSPCGE